MEGVIVNTLLNGSTLLLAIALLYGLWAMAYTVMLRRRANEQAVRGEALPAFRPHDTAVSRGRSVVQLMSFGVSIVTLLVLLLACASTIFIVVVTSERGDTSEWHGPNGIDPTVQLATALPIFFFLALLLMATLQIVVDAFRLYNYRINRIEAEGLARSKSTLIKFERVTGWTVWLMGVVGGVAVLVFLLTNQVG